MTLGMLGTINGVKFTEYLRDTGNRAPVIFISSSRDYVLDAYSAEPVGYVMKPIDKAKLSEALKRAIRKLKPAAVVVDTPSVTVSFNIQDVMYIEVFNKTLLLHMQDGTVTKISKLFLLSVKLCRRIASFSATGAISLLCQRSSQSSVLKLR